MARASLRLLTQLYGTRALSDLPGIEEESDEKLIARIAGSRDRNAFTQLFRRFAGPVRGVLMKGGASVSEADEAVQAMEEVRKFIETTVPES